MLEQTKQMVSVNGSKTIVTTSIIKRYFGENSSFGAAGPIDVGSVRQIGQYFEGSWTEEIGFDGDSDDGSGSNDDDDFDDFDTGSASTAHALAVLVWLLTAALYLKSRIV